MEVLKHHSILYAEDESIIRLNMSRRLRKYFNNVIIAKDGEEAFSLSQGTVNNSVSTPHNL